jgi:hypothetical protein
MNSGFINATCDTTTEEEPLVVTGVCQNGGRSAKLSICNSIEL